MLIIIIVLFIITAFLILKMCGMNVRYHQLAAEFKAYKTNASRKEILTQKTLRDAHRRANLRSR